MLEESQGLLMMLPNTLQTDPKGNLPARCRRSLSSLHVQSKPIGL